MSHAEGAPLSLDEAQQAFLGLVNRKPESERSEIIAQWKMGLARALRDIWKFLETGGILINNQGIHHFGFDDPYAMELVSTRLRDELESKVIIPGSVGDPELIGFHFEKVKDQIAGNTTITLAVPNLGSGLTYRVHNKKAIFEPSLKFKRKVDWIANPFNDMVESPLADHTKSVLGEEVIGVIFGSKTLFVPQITRAIILAKVEYGKRAVTLHPQVSSSVQNTASYRR